MNNTMWHPASEVPKERTEPLLLATKITWHDKDGKMLQGISTAAYFLDCIADIISWNVWQMDGLKKTVPGTGIPCKIKDWKADKEILFKDVM